MLLISLLFLNRHGNTQDDQNNITESVEPNKEEPEKTTEVESLVSHKDQALGINLSFAHPPKWTIKSDTYPIGSEKVSSAVVKLTSPDQKVDVTITKRNTQGGMGAACASEGESVVKRQTTPLELSSNISFAETVYRSVETGQYFFKASLEPAREPYLGIKNGTVGKCLLSYSNFITEKDTGITTDAPYLIFADIRVDSFYESEFVMKKDLSFETITSIFTDPTYTAAANILKSVKLSR